MNLACVLIVKIMRASLWEGLVSIQSASELIMKTATISYTCMSFMHCTGLCVYSLMSSQLLCEVFPPSPLMHEETEGQRSPVLDTNFAGSWWQE